MKPRAPNEWTNSDEIFGDANSFMASLIKVKNARKCYIFAWKLCSFTQQINSCVKMYR